jgi:ABC-2 type transport system permease protein
LGAPAPAAVLCFVVPVLLASAFGTIFARPAAGAGAPKLQLLVVVEGDGPFTRQVADDLRASPRFDAREVSRAAAEGAVADKKAVAVVLPAGFERLKEWQPGVTAERPELLLLHHPSASAERHLTEGVVTELVMKHTTREAFADVIMGADAGGLAPPFKVEPAAVSAHGGRFSAYAHSFCGMTVQYLLFWGMESGLLLLRERRQGAWTRVRTAAVPLSCVLAGKALATAAVALLQVLGTFAVGYLVFGVKVEGSFLGFVLVALAACGLAAATGLLVAALGGTEARARNVSILVILGVSMLGGLWVPAFLLPSWARDASAALPTTWALKGFETVTWQGGGFWAAVPSALAVGGFALALFALAALKLRHTERGFRQGKV